jgi:hypothetical protein
VNLLEREATAQQTLKLISTFAQSKRNSKARELVKVI